MNSRSASKFNPARLLPALAFAAIAMPVTAIAAGAQGNAWWLDVEAGAEYDDNVAIEQNDSNAAKGDYAAVFEVDGGYKLLDEKDARIEVGYNFYQSLYQDLTQFDYQSHNPSLMAWIRQDGIKLGFEYAYTHSMLDDSFFLDQHMLSPTVSTFLTEDFFITAYYRYLDKNYNRADDARDAKTHQTGADVYYYFDRPNKGYFSAGAGFTSEDTQGPAFDYDGFMGRIAAQYPFMAFDMKSKVRISYTYQRRDYDSTASLTPVTGDTRADDRHTFRITSEMELVDNLKATAEFRHVTRDSNLATANYEENVGGLGLRYSF